MGNEDVNPFYGRIEQIADYYGLTLRGLSVKLGLPSPQIFYDMKSGKIKNLSGKIIKAIQENLPEVNILWVMMGVESMLTNSTQKNKIPLYDDVATIGGVNEQVANVDDSARPTEWIDAGDWFPTATSAYIKPDQGKVDAANRRVIDFINGNGPIPVGTEPKP